VVFNFDFKVFVQLTIHFIVRKMLGKTYPYCGTRPKSLFLEEEAVFWRREPFLEEGAVFWRREPFSGRGSRFLEEGAVF
jgi:hypothetical protein